MNSAAKIHLSVQEKELVSNKDWLFLKRSIIEKVSELLGSLHHEFRILIEKEESFLPAGIKNHGGKISRGENHKGLPFLILDYPALFRKHDIFAIRTLFWWGNFFSISLQLSGEHFFLRKELVEQLSFLESLNFFIYVGDDDWDHDLNSGDYILLEHLISNQLSKISDKKFFKISKKIEWNSWDDIADLLVNGFNEIIQFLKISYHPIGEKGL